MSIKVTIGVITYNSAKFIKEALDSCLLQNCEDIELFISDDASQDGTQDIISGWLQEHGQSFAKSEFVAQPKNLGGRHNSNFVLHHCQGEYLRTLEGDDVLVEGAIEKLLAFIKKDEDIKFLFSNRLNFQDDITQAVLGRLTSEKFIKADAKGQYKMLLTGMQANGPTTFFHRQTLIDIGGRVGTRNVGDLPTMLNITRQGYKLYCCKEPLLYYRKHEESMTSNVTNLERWKQIKYEMMEYCNENLISKDIGVWLKMYCYYDLLRSKKRYKGISFNEHIIFFLLQPFCRIYKLFVC